MSCYICRFLYIIFIVFPFSSSFALLQLYTSVFIFSYLVIVIDYCSIFFLSIVLIWREFNKTCILFGKFNKNSFDYGLNLRNELFKIIPTECENKMNEKGNDEKNTNWNYREWNRVCMTVKIFYTSTYWIDVLHTLCINEEKLCKSQRIDESKQNKKKQYQWNCSWQLFLLLIIYFGNVSENPVTHFLYKIFVYGTTKRLSLFVLESAQLNTFALHVTH